MAQLPQAFDAKQYDPSQSVGQLPVGEHKVIIESDELKETAAGGSGMLVLTLKIIEGPQAGTTGAYNLNLYNQSETAKQIAHKQLSAICHCVGVFNVQDTRQLHNLPFIVKVAPQKDKPEYTEVKKVFDANGIEPGKQGQGAAQPAAQAQLAAQGFQQPPAEAQPATQPAQQPPAQGGWNSPAAQDQPAAEKPAWA